VILSLLYRGPLLFQWFHGIVHIPKLSNLLMRKDHLECELYLVYLADHVNLVQLQVYCREHPGSKLYKPLGLGIINLLRVLCYAFQIVAPVIVNLICTALREIH
jgi:hypothetical protein